MDLILKYFPELTALQTERFAALDGLYRDWNAKINVISRKDMESFYERHVLHSLAIAQVCRFDDGARILDVGSGGGFPGIPLAIMFPQARFTLIDSIGKKTTVIRGVRDALGLENVEVINGRAEQVSGRFDYVVSRAVTEMRTFLGWVWDKIASGQAGSLANGVVALKGGDLTDELLAANRQFTQFDIGDFYPEEFFQTKKIIHIKR